MPYECVVLGETPPTAEDRLSKPTPADLLPTLIGNAPRGRAWSTDEWHQPDGATTQHRFWRGLAHGFAWLYETATEVVLSSTVVTAGVPQIEDWEQELGLPDPCVQTGTTAAQRRKAARLRMMQGGASPGYFVCLASRYGIAVTIKDGILPFEAGRSECGGDDGCDDDELAWYVTASSPGADGFFEAGAGEAGLTPLGERPVRKDLECLFTRVAPAHTTIWFRYGDPTADATVTTTGGPSTAVPLTADSTLITADFVSQE